MSNRDIDSSSENVLSDWDRAADEVDEPVEGSADEAEYEGGAPAWGTAAGAMDADDDAMLQTSSPPKRSPRPRK